MFLTDNVRRFLLKKAGGDTRCMSEFLRACPTGAAVLDVGCGNASPQHVKAIRPDVHYVGIDVGDHAQTEDSVRSADEYILEPPETFHRRIEQMAGRFDAVISAHNIEHCDEPDKTLVAMIGALKPGGRLFLSFPCEASVGFPRRAGTLNFHDDPTHARMPRFDAVEATIRSHGLTVLTSSRRYRPWLKMLYGLAEEPLSMWRRRVMLCTWSLYGFESIIWASRPSDRVA